MTAAARIASATGLVILLIAGCAPHSPNAALIPVQQEELPSLPDRQDFTQINRQGIVRYVTTDPGWQAWLQAASASDIVNNDIVDGSTSNLQVGALSAALTFAKDRYRRATSFYLTPVMLRSGCLNLPSETAGTVVMPSGLVLRYSYLSSAPHLFPNGSSCLVSTGYVSEVDSSRGIAILTSGRATAIDWDQNFAYALIWNRPFAEISQSDSYSVSDLIALISP